AARLRVKGHALVALLRSGSALRPFGDKQRDCERGNSSIIHSSRVGMKEDLLDPFYPPRGMSRTQSAAYISVSPSLFDQMVADGRMPQPRMINKRVVWDRVELDAAFSALPHKNEAADDEFAEWKARV